MEPGEPMNWTQDRIISIRQQHAVLATEYHTLRALIGNPFVVKAEDKTTRQQIRRLSDVRTKLLELEMMRAKGGKHVVRNIYVVGKTKRRKNAIASLTEGNASRGGHAQ